MRRSIYMLFLLQSFVLLPAIASGQSMVCLQSCVGSNISGQRMASCQGCDWYVQCGSISSSVLQCPSGQLFHVTEGQCVSQARAACGKDHGGNALQPSSSFQPAVKDVVLEADQATTSGSSGFLGGMFDWLWTWIGSFIEGFIDGVSPTTAADTVPLGTATSTASTPTTSGGGILKVMFEFIGGFLDAISGGGDGSSGFVTTASTTPGLAPTAPTTLRTILTQTATWPTQRTSRFQALGCVQSCQQVPPLPYSVHALCGRCSYFLACSYGVSYVRRCAPYTYFLAAGGQCVADANVCQTQSFMANDPAKADGEK